MGGRSKDTQKVAQTSCWRGLDPCSRPLGNPVYIDQDDVEQAERNWWFPSSFHQAPVPTTKRAAEGILDRTASIGTPTRAVDSSMQLIDISCNCIGDDQQVEHWQLDNGQHVTVSASRRDRHDRVHFSLFLRDAAARSSYMPRAQRSRPCRSTGNK